MRYRGWRRPRLRRAAIVLALIGILSMGVLPPSGAEWSAKPSSAEDQPPDQMVAPTAPVGDTVVNRSAYSRTEFDATHGVYTSIFSERPMHWEDQSTGEWKPFDNTLRPAVSSPGYLRENTSGSMRMAFESATDVSLGRPAAKVTKGAASIRMTAIGAAPARAEVSGPGYATSRRCKTPSRTSTSRWMGNV